MGKHNFFPIFSRLLNEWKLKKSFKKSSTSHIKASYLVIPNTPTIMSKHNVISKQILNSLIFFFVCYVDFCEHIRDRQKKKTKKGYFFIFSLKDFFFSSILLHTRENFCFAIFILPQMLLYHVLFLKRRIKFLVKNKFFKKRTFFKK